MKVVVTKPPRYTAIVDIDNKTIYTDYQFENTLIKIDYESLIELCAFYKHTPINDKPIYILAAQKFIFKTFDGQLNYHQMQEDNFNSLLSKNKIISYKDNH